MLQKTIKKAETERFPDLEFSLLTGERVLFPGQPDEKWTVLFLYDDSSCPVCRQQLMDFQKLLHQRPRENLRVVAVFGDDRKRVINALWDLTIPFPIAYGVDTSRLKIRAGLTYPGENTGADATCLLISPEGRIAGSFCGVGRYPDDWFSAMDQPTPGAYEAVPDLLPVPNVRDIDNCDDHWRFANQMGDRPTINR